jgi:hypothetical protein
MTKPFLNYKMQWWRSQPNARQVLTFNFMTMQHLLQDKLH